MPAASITAVAPASSQASTRRSARTSGRAGPPPSVTRACSTTATARRPDDSRKCTATMAGFSFVRTTSPPTMAWATIPSGSTADRRVRSRRGWPSADRYRQQAMKASPAMATSG
ncbi:MAG TPA: hypothetical protein VHZ03_22410 [Trebonia sp.]|nr:hypothetical protein [Trebonia sp.]